MVIADDHAVLRAGLNMLLNAQPDIEVIGEAVDSEEAIRKVAELTPDVLLLDISMPGVGGIEVIRAIKAKMLRVAILILTMHEDEGYLRQALKGGALGYIPKKAAGDELISAIKAVQRGEVFVYSSLTKALVGEVIYGADTGGERVVDSLQQLSQREQEVLRRVAQGYNNRQIAEHLYLSVKTVESYKARAMEKLKLHSRVDLVRYAVQHGLISDDK